VHRVTDEARRIMAARYETIWWTQPVTDWSRAHPLIADEIEQLRADAGEAQRPDLQPRTVPL
jgi:hypothetical protein